MHKTIVEPNVWMYGFQNVWWLGYYRVNVWREKKNQVGNDITTHWCTFFLLFERLKNN